MDSSEAVWAWERLATDLLWSTPWEVAYEKGDTSGEWFVGGRLNVAVNCLDRHLPAAAAKPALHWEGEPGDRRTVTYGELDAEVRAFASALQQLGVASGDRVALYMGLVPETVVVMLACARLGAVHAILPSPLPSDALADRLEEISPRILVTQDGAWRRGAMLPLKARADEALAAVSSVQHAVVVRRTGIDVNWFEGDRWYHELIASADAAAASAPGSFPAGHPLLLVHHATRRGRPRAIVHGSGGFLAYTRALHAGALSVAPDGVYWCAMEIAWLSAQSHGIYGPLSCGGTAVLTEGTLDMPSTDRTWNIIERYRVDSWLTSPVVLRRLRGWTHRAPSLHSLASLRRVVTAGEPLDASTRRWLQYDIARGRVHPLDGWGQTELGGIVTLTPTPVGSQVVPDPGLAVVNDRGEEVVTGELGQLVLRNPWPGTFLEILNDRETAAAYWSQQDGSFLTGDIGQRDAAETLTVLGRTDPVINVSGQLVAGTEIRATLLEHPEVEQAEIVGAPDSRTGQAVVACVLLRAATPQDEAMAAALRTHVYDTLGGLARPRTIVFLDWLPQGYPTLRLHHALRMLCAELQTTTASIPAGALHAALAAAEGALQGTSPARLTATTISRDA